MIERDNPIRGIEPKTRYVIFHRPGPAWVAEAGVLEQKGVTQHFEYLQSAFLAGKIEMGGPFVAGASGGMIIMSPQSGEVDARELIAGDPGVISKLILAEVAAWMVTLG
jgi:uncharacterized protein YciI